MAVIEPVAALRDPADVQVVEFAPQVSPAPGEPDCFIAAGFVPCLDQVGIGRVAIHLQDTAEPGEVARVSEWRIPVTTPGAL